MKASSAATEDWPIASYSAALLKVASRCNLNCDYCYVYQHADQSWRHQPKLMSKATVQQFGSRLNDYVVAQGLDRFLVIYHGGEPLLYGADGLARLTASLRETVRDSCDLEFSLQTNGVLLTDDVLETLGRAEISVSLSLDGPRHIHDRHRLNHAGRSTFDATMAALERLCAAGTHAFTGVIAVIDPSVPPREVLNFFAQFGLPRLDLLYPTRPMTHRRRAAAKITAYIADGSRRLSNCGSESSPPSQSGGSTRFWQRGLEFQARLMSWA